MPDHVHRTLERQATQSGDIQERARVLASWMREDPGRRDAVGLAAYCGDEVARVVVNHSGAEAPTFTDFLAELDNWPGALELGALVAAEGRRKTWKCSGCHENEHKGNWREEGLATLALNEGVPHEQWSQEALEYEPDAEDLAQREWERTPAECTCNRVGNALSAARAHWENPTEEAREAWRLANVAAYHAMGETTRWLPRAAGDNYADAIQACAREMFQSAHREWPCLPEKGQILARTAVSAGLIAWALGADQIRDSCGES